MGFAHACAMQETTGLLAKDPTSIQRVCYASRSHQIVLYKIYGLQDLFQAAELLGCQSVMHIPQWGAVASSGSLLSSFISE